MSDIKEFPLEENSRRIPAIETESNRTVEEIESNESVGRNESREKPVCNIQYTKIHNSLDFPIEVYLGDSKTPEDKVASNETKDVSMAFPDSPTAADVEAHLRIVVKSPEEKTILVWCNENCEALYSNDLRAGQGKLIKPRKLPIPVPQPLTVESDTDDNGNELIWIVGEVDVAEEAPGDDGVESNPLESNE